MTACGLTTRVRPTHTRTQVLYPPLTYLQPLLRQKIRGMEEGLVITLKAVFPS